MAGVPNPHTAAPAPNLKSLGANSYNSRGTFSCTPPAGSKYYRLDIRSAGGGGGAGASSSNHGGAGGGGATYRVFGKLASLAAIPVTVGAGGACVSNNNGLNGTTSSCLGYTPTAGTGGMAYSAGGVSGVDAVGTNGNDPGFGFGYFTGPFQSSLGSGGVTAGPGQGGVAGTAALAGNGGDGYVHLEFFG